MFHKNYDKYIKNDSKFTYKKALYSLRSLFCAKYIYENHKIPPVKFTKLVNELNLDNQIIEFINQILEKKSKSNEKQEINNKQEIKTLIENFAEEIEGLKIKDNKNKEELTNYLSNILIEIKKIEYNIQ